MVGALVVPCGLVAGGIVAVSSRGAADKANGTKPAADLTPGQGAGIDGHAGPPADRCTAEGTSDKANGGADDKAASRTDGSARDEADGRADDGTCDGTDRCVAEGTCEEADRRPDERADDGTRDPVEAPRPHHTCRHREGQAGATNFAAVAPGHEGNREGLVRREQTRMGRGDGDGKRAITSRASYRDAGIRAIAWGADNPRRRASSDDRSATGRRRLRQGQLRWPEQHNEPSAGDTSLLSGWWLSVGPLDNNDSSFADGITLPSTLSQFNFAGPLSKTGPTTERGQKVMATKGARPRPRRQRGTGHPVRVGVLRPIARGGSGRRWLRRHDRGSVRPLGRRDQHLRSNERNSAGIRR
jgi:hypothetical protein